MRMLFIIVVVMAILGLAFTSCKSSSGPPTFCDTSCMKDSLKFTRQDNRFKPYVYISAKNCMADTVTWSYDGMGANRKLSIPDLVGKEVHLNKDFVRCTINDTSYAWLLFNDCSNGRGYSIKIPFDKKKPLGPKNSAVNSIDPKFSVAEGMVAYTDRGNIFVEEMATGKKAMMTFGQDISPDYNAIHETIDSVNITPTRIWAKVKIKDEWKELEKKITLQ
ncbi:MAG: hypothetical protein Q8941_16635 [Bacteroidota bacterium]|nr:hypothetical protein [Bacteroidota bacterium]